MKTTNIIKLIGITVISLLFISILSVGIYFEATHNGSQDYRNIADFNILNIYTVNITALCIIYALLMIPWILYFIRIEKKSGLQYFSIYPISGKDMSKYTSIALTFLNISTILFIYIKYLNYTNKYMYTIATDHQLSILGLLCCAIIFWGGVYMAYGSVYGIKRIKNIIKKKREKKRLRKIQELS